MPQKENEFLKESFRIEYDDRNRTTGREAMRNHHRIVASSSMKARNDTGIAIEHSNDGGGDDQRNRHIYVN